MRHITSSLVVLCFGFGFASAQETPELIDRLGGMNSEAILVNVGGVAFKGDAVAVMTINAPFVHIFDADGYRAFGREGGGPAEFDEPAGIEWPDSSIVVLDDMQQKWVTFRDDGTFVASRSLAGFLLAREIGADRPSALYIVGGDTIVGITVPFAPERFVLRLRGEERDTVLAYRRRGEAEVLQVEGAPIYHVRPPFLAQTTWTVLADGAVAVWDPDEPDAIRLLDGTGTEIGRIGGIEGSFPVTEADREEWFDRLFVRAEFQGRRIFEPLLPLARERLDIPDRFPRALELMADPSGGVWVRKTAPGTGEVWTLVSRAGEPLGTVRFGAGFRLLQAGERALAVRETDELDVESVAIYARPAWADADLAGAETRGH